MVRLAALALLLALAAPAAAQRVDVATVDSLVGDWPRFADLEALGPGVLPILADLYEKSPYPARRRTIANVFYRLGRVSPDAKRVLLLDLDTQDRELRLAVQWALGRVSADDDVAPRLLAIMRDDPNPLFRDKAGCALAHDQAHLSPEQKLRLYEGLIGALDDSKPQVRSLAIRVLRIHTGQTQGFAALGKPAARAASIDAWRLWLAQARDTSLQVSDSR